MLYVDTGSLDRCYPGGKPHLSQAAGAGCKLHLYGGKVSSFNSSLVTNPWCPSLSTNGVHSLEEESDLFQSLCILFLGKQADVLGAKSGLNQLPANNKKKKIVASLLSGWVFLSKQGVTGVSQKSTEHTVMLSYCTYPLQQAPPRWLDTGRLQTLSRSSCWLRSWSRTRTPLQARRSRI